MKTLYQTLATYDGDYEDLLQKLRLMDIFEPIIKEFDIPTAKSIIRYIAYVYSKESEYVLAKDGWDKVKQRCAEVANLSKDLWSQILQFIPRNDDDTLPATIKKVAIKYLSHQNDRNNRDLKSLYDLYDELIVAAASPAKTMDDYESKYKCRRFANEVRDWIKDAEGRMSEEESVLKAAKQELKTKGSHHSIRPENSAQ